MVGVVVSAAALRALQKIVGLVTAATQAKRKATLSPTGTTMASSPSPSKILTMLKLMPKMAADKTSMRRAKEMLEVSSSVAASSLVKCVVVLDVDIAFALLVY